MTIRLYEKQADLLAEFLSNMAVVWFGAAFISTVSLHSTAAYIANGVISLYLALGIKGQ